MVSDASLDSAEIVDDFKKQNKEIIPISIIDLASLEKIKKLLNQIAKEKQTPLFIENIVDN